MRMVTIPLLLIVFSCLYFSCSNTGDTKQARQSQPESRTSVHKELPKPDFEFAKVALYSIDKSIYQAADTTWDFTDGKLAYKNFFRGGSFVDSSGNPIHNRYKKFLLDKEQAGKFRSDFLLKLCDELSFMCIHMYRDVLVFYDHQDKVAGQAQICFGCQVIAVHPSKNFLCAPERRINYDSLKSFINGIKKNKPVGNGAHLLFITHFSYRL